MPKQNKAPLRNILGNQKGFALLGAYLVSIVLLITSFVAFSSSFTGARVIDRETARAQAYASAEAGLQAALAQIGRNAYLGSINTATIAANDLKDVNGVTVGSYSATMLTPSPEGLKAGWIICRVLATSGNETRMIEGRIFLNTNLSKYPMFASLSSPRYAAAFAFGQGDADHKNESSDLKSQAISGALLEKAGIPWGRFKTNASFSIANSTSQDVDGFTMELLRENSVGDAEDATKVTEGIDRATPHYIRPSGWPVRPVLRGVREIQYEAE